MVGNAPLRAGETIRRGVADGVPLSIDRRHRGRHRVPGWKSKQALHRPRPPQQPVTTDLITNHDRWLSRNVIRTQSDNKIEFEDWEGPGTRQAVHGAFRQIATQHLAIWWMGSGRSGGGVRAADRCGGQYPEQGSAAQCRRAQARTGQQLDMQEALSELRLALDRVSALAHATKLAGATPADNTTQSELLSAMDQLKGAGILATAPGGLAFLTPESIQHSASRNIILTSGKRIDVSAVKRFAVAAGELISLCAHKLGVKLFAAKGKVEIQAQTDALDLFAAKRLHIASADDDVVVSAQGKTTLMCDGAYIRLAGGSIEIGCPGDFNIKSASFSYSGPDRLDAVLPVLPNSEPLSIDKYRFSI